MKTISRAELIQLWERSERKVELAIMLTTAQKESGVGDLNGDGLSDLFAVNLERYEHGIWTAKWARDYCAKVHHPLAREDCCSWGPFQILGIVLHSLGVMHYAQIAHAQAMEAGQLSVEEYVLDAMNAYDYHMGRLIKSLKGDLPLAFERYNGSGPGAREYRARAEIIWRKIKTLHEER